MNEKTEKPATPSRQEPVPVKLLRFRQGIDVPGKSQTTSLGADWSKPSNKAFHLVEFLPWLRSFKITFHSMDVNPDGSRKPPQVCMVPESWASWEPV